MYPVVRQIILVYRNIYVVHKTKTNFSHLVLHGNKIMHTFMIFFFVEVILIFEYIRL